MAKYMDGLFHLPDKMNHGLDPRYLQGLQEIKGAKDCSMKVLFINCVGSHMWEMQTKKSDIDLVTIYIAPTKSILRGEKILQTIRQEIRAEGTEVYDTLGWEVGHLIDLLVKGNVNAIWYATSPLVVQPSPIQEELSGLVKANLCRKTYHSIKGMAESQIKSESAAGAGRSDKPGKGYRTALRTLNFGINLLREKKLSFTPVLHNPDCREVEERMIQLKEAYLTSKLPDLPDEDIFWDFLLRLRLEELRGDARYRDIE